MTAPPPPAPEVEALRVLLMDLSPRARHVLSRLLVDGFDLPQAAAHFGIGPDALSVMLLRAMYELAGSAGPTDAGAELAQANALALAWDRGPAAPTPELERACTVASRIRANGPAIRRRWEEAELEYEDSPRGRRELWLRRVLVVVVVGLALFFLQRKPP